MAKKQTNVKKRSGKKEILLAGLCASLLHLTIQM